MGANDMSGLAIFAIVIVIGFVAAAAWLTGLFLRAPRGFQNSGGFGIDRRKWMDPDGSAADRRVSADANAADENRAPGDATPTQGRRGTRKYDR